MTDNGEVVTIEFCLITFCGVFTMYPFWLVDAVSVVLTVGVDEEDTLAISEADDEDEADEHDEVEDEDTVEDGLWFVFSLGDDVNNARLKSPEEACTGI